VEAITQGFGQSLSLRHPQEARAVLLEYDKTVIMSHSASAWGEACE
jgi:hypothetical protein